MAKPGQTIFFTIEVWCGREFNVLRSPKGYRRWPR